MNGCLVAAIFKQILKKNETALLTRREERRKSERVSMVAKNKKQNKQTLKWIFQVK